jgi:hypothetical protein
MCSPTQVEVLSTRGDGGFKTPQGVEQVRSHEDAGGGHHENVDHRIVLLLVHFMGLDSTVDLPESIALESHADQAAWIVPLDEFGSHDSRVRTKCLFDHDTDCVGSECHLVGQEEEIPVSSLHQLEDRIDSLPEPWISGYLAKVCPGKTSLRNTRDVIHRRGIRLGDENENLKIRIVLIGK